MQDDFDPNLLLEDSLEAEAPAGRYRALRCLGMGPVSETFLVQDLWNENREKVQRLFQPEVLHKNSDLLPLFLAPLAKLRHPNLVPILDLGEESGRAYIVSEKIEGSPWAQVIGHAQAPQLLYLLGQLLLTLDYLHSENIFHLNLKPENIHVDMRANPWRLRLSDYGLAALALPKKQETPLKPSPYLDPQFIENRVPDPRYDLYSLGLLSQGLRAQLPAPFAAWLQKMTHGDLAQRFSGARQAFEALQQISQTLLGKKNPGATNFSTYEEVWREEEYTALFRKIAIKGKLWAVIGERGSGKSYLAKYFERLFWLNHKKVYRVDGREMDLLKNDLFINPFEATYILIDHAEACPAWLVSHDHLNIVAFFENDLWLKNKTSWTKHRLTALPPSSLEKNAHTLLSGSGLETKLLALLSRTQAELTPLFIAEALGIEAHQTQNDLEKLTEQGLVQHNLSLGYATYSTEIVSSVSNQEFDAEETSRILLLLSERGFAKAGVAFLQSYFGKKILQDPSLMLQKAEYSAQLGRFLEVLKIITATFIKKLIPELHAKAFELLGRSLLALEKDKQAEAALRNAYKAYQSHQDFSGQARVLQLMGRIYQRGGEVSKALKFFEQSLGECEKSKNSLSSRGETEMAIAKLYAQATDGENAEFYFQKSIQTLYDSKDDFHLTQAYTDYAELALQSQDLNKAQMLNSEALVKALQLDSPLLKARLALVTSEIYRQQGRTTSLTQSLHEALNNFQQTDLTHDILKTLVKRAAFFETIRELYSAFRDAQLALEQATEQQDLERQAEAHWIMAKIFRRDWKQVPRAIKHIDQAIAKFNKISKREKIWECYSIKAQIEMERNRTKLVRPLYQQALQSLEETLSQLSFETEQFRHLSAERKKLEETIKNL